MTLVFEHVSQRSFAFCSMTACVCVWGVGNLGAKVLFGFCSVTACARVCVCVCEDRQPVHVCVCVEWETSGPKFCLDFVL